MIRPYKPADRSSVLALVRLNTPEYFHPSEEEDLSFYLESSVQTLIVRTSQLVYRFYEKQGFELEKVVKDYWAEGYDLYLMRYTK